MVILAIVAVGIVAKNIILPLLPSAHPLSIIESNGERIQLKEEAFQQIETMESELDSVVDFNNMDWAHDYLRDPFMTSDMWNGMKLSVEKIGAPVVSGEEKLPLQDVLVAVVHDSGKALAVINDVIVGEGDYYEDFRVIKIGSDSVELEGPDGNKTLEF